MSRDGEDRPQLDDVPLSQEPQAPPPPIAPGTLAPSGPTASIGPEEVPEATRSRRRWFLTVVIVLFLVSLGAAYVIFRRGLQPEPVLPSPPVEPPALTAPLPTPESTPPLTVLPPLNDSDATLREAAAGLASHPAFGQWLTEDDLVRRFTATVDNLAEGANPKVHLPFLAPRGAFQVRERQGRVFIDPASYRRYDTLGDVAAEIDAEQAATLFRTFEPLVNSAYRELGYPEGAFRDKLTLAIQEALAAPILEGEIEVEPLVLTYAYQDPALESLSPAQKQLLRAGPRNTRIVQQQLRRLAKELELPIN